MDVNEKLEFLTNELIAIHEDYETLVNQQIMTRNFLKHLIEFAKETNSPYSKNENGEYTLSRLINVIGIS